MPGFVIHIAVGKEYIKKHVNEIKNKEKFYEGILAPDLISLTDKNVSKSETHYGRWGNKELDIHLKEFLQDKSVDISDDYWKGYFIHLLTDDAFYLKYFKEETIELIKNHDKFYYDYDCLNKSLIEKYHIDNMKNENISKYMGHVDGTPKYLKEDKVEKFIEDFSNINIEEQIELIKWKL